MSGELQKENFTKSTLLSLAWQYASTFSQALLQIVVLAILARLLAPEDFGVVGIAMIFVGFAALFSQVGIGPALIQRSDLTDVHLRVGFTISVLFSLLLTLLLWAGAPFIAAFFRNDQLVSVLPVLGIDFLFTGCGVVAESLLRRSLLFNKLMWANLASQLFGYALIGVTLAWLGYGVWALVWATLGQGLIYNILLLRLRPHPLTPLLKAREVRELLFFGGGFTLARFLNYSANNGDYIVIGRMLGTETLGIYSRAYQLMQLPARYLGEVLNVVLFPVMARVQKQQQQLTGVYLTGVAMVSLVNAPLSVLMVTLAPEIVEVLLGPKWSNSVVPFQVLAFAVLPRISYKIDDALAKALGVMYQRSLRDAIYAVAVILGAAIGLRWGITGAATGVLGATILNYVLAVRMSMKLLNCSWADFVETQIAGICLAVVSLFVGVLTSSVLRMYGLPAWFILITTVFAATVSIIGLFLLQPQVVGVYGTSVLHKILPLMPPQVVPRAVSQWVEGKLRHSVR